MAAIIWGTKIALDNAVRVARHYRVSDFFIGVAILAVGSDLPEIVVSMAAAFRRWTHYWLDNSTWRYRPATA